MKRIIAFSVLAALAICGCQVKEIGELPPESKINPEAKVFTAVIEDNNPETKTSLDNNGNVFWKLGDQVCIFAGSTINEQYQVTDESDGETSASLYRVTSPGFVAGTDIDNNVAFYPYSSSVTIAKSESAYILKKITLPSTQNYAEGSFGNGAFPMTAVTSSADDMRLKFKNVLGGLKLQLKGTAKIASVSVTGNGNEILCGAAEVTVANGSVPSITLTDATAKTVTLDCGEGVQLNPETATLFIIALPPMTMEGGFTVVVSDTSGGQMEIKTTKPQTFNRSNLLKMPAVTYDGTPVSGSIEGHEWVDLGLPSGLKWATCNVGANAPEEYGDYFAWGETEQKNNYDWSTYQWCNGNYTMLTKYNTNTSFGSVDNKTILEYADDAGRANWGGSWRMPLDYEWRELIDNCTCTWTTQNGVDGLLVNGPNGNTIFLPATLSTSSGFYWTSSLSWSRQNLAFYLLFRSDVVDIRDNLRCLGYSVRPVTDEGVRVSVSGITLNQNALLLEAGATTWLSATVTPSNATQPAVIWSTSNNSVAAVDYMGCVTAVSGGTATITASTYDGGIIAICEVTVYQQYDGEENGHYYIDLGLPSGLKWATCNLGADTPEGYGDYYAWGEIEPYYSSLDPLTWKDGKSDGYDWGSYRWGGSNTLIKYNVDSSYGSVDNKTALELQDDAANSNWGGSWRMPTKAEWDELFTECTWTWTSYGYLVTSSNGNSILLPAAGRRMSVILKDIGFDGRYWSSDLYMDRPDCAWNIVFYTNSSPPHFLYSARRAGLVVRPVLDEGVCVNVSGLSLEETSAFLELGQSRILTATVLPEDATNKSVTWESSDPNIASVSESGVVTGHHIGSTTITATTTDGGFTASCEVKVMASNTRTTNIVADLGVLKQAAMSQTRTAPLSLIYEEIGIDQTDWLNAYGEPIMTSYIPSGVTTSYDSNSGFEVQFNQDVAIGVGSLSYTFSPQNAFIQLTPTIVYNIRWSIQPTTGVENNHEWVDLGLPSGLKWATCNVGATAPEEYGDYFAWGETEPYYTEGHSQDSPCSTWKTGKTGYNWASYKFELGTDNNGPFSKYVTKSSYGSVDNKTVLDSEDDAASVNWGGSWRMPTDDNWTELRTECSWTWTTQNGVNGRLVTGPNCNSIFLPAAGIRSDTYLLDTGSYGHYWSSSLHTDYPLSARRVDFDSDDVVRSGNNRHYGHSVRPVTE